MSMIINPYAFGGGAPQPGFRYWRILVSTAESAYVGFAEVEFRVGGVAQYGGTPSASETFAGLTPGNAFDGNPATDWANNGDLPVWLRYDYGAGGNKEIDTVMIESRAYLGQGPTNFKIQCSNDNSTWADRKTVTSAPVWGSNEQRVFTLDPP